MKRPNEDIRETLAKRRIRQCEVAFKLGIGECTMSRWLRAELPPDRKQRIERAIDEITEELYA